MDWYVIDAVEVAYERTKRCLFEPFDLWKWVKLAIILMLVGGGSGHGGNSFNSFSNSMDSDYGSGYGSGYGSDYNPLDSIGDTFDSIFSAAVMAIIALVLFLIIIFMYVSSVMEFVLVESLVSNSVKFWEYTRHFLGKGFQLFIIRIAALLLSLLVLAVLLLPFVLLFGMPSGDYFWLSFIGGMMLVIFLVIIFAVIASVFGSFISMSIPIALYNNVGVLSAIMEVLRKFKLDWQQIVVYWVGRAVLGIIVGIAALIVMMLAILVTLLPFLIVDGILYLLLSLVLSGSEWIVLVPFILVEVILFIIVMALVSMPFGAFLKYHMLSFVEKWYLEAGIPFDQGIDLKA
ncbi:hypothetical protein [Methanomethylovorans sp.]|uniref:DUF7544 domain-containing protein n=1 Tax=Methanomethylovorans sp. TaxID=2758717 RepID=UPI00351C3C31